MRALVIRHLAAALLATAGAATLSGATDAAAVPHIHTAAVTTEYAATIVEY